jgi:predicted nucleotide-binding protein
VDIDTKLNTIKAIQQDTINLRNSFGDPKKIDAFRQKTEMLLRRMLGKDSGYLKDFDLIFYGISSLPVGSLDTFQYLERLDNLLSTIEQEILLELQEDKIPESEFDLVSTKLLEFELQGIITQVQKAALASAISRLLNEAARKRDALEVVRIQELESRLEKIRATVAPPTDANRRTSYNHNPVAEEAASSKIFIVHGRDKKMKNAVMRVLRKVDLEPITLEARRSGGKTISEKLEHYSKEVSYAVVLLSPDDKGYFKKDGSKKARPRARQNVILELGFFWGRIGRDHVVVLYPVKDIKFERPSDYDGVVYIPYDGTKNWKLSLVTELGADVNKLLERRTLRH